MSVARIKLQDWVLDVDKAETALYAKQELASHCTCGYCKNYYETAEDTYPLLRPFLEHFGIEINAPASLVPYEVGDEVCYDAVYPVSGKIVKAGKTILWINRLPVTVKASMDINCDMNEPFFFLKIGNVTVPWVQKETFSKVDSPVKAQKTRQQLINMLYQNEDPFMLS